MDARTTTSGVTPLHLAAASGSGAIVTLLLEQGADADAKESEWGQTPLMFAAAENRVAAIRALLDYGADSTVTTKTIDIAHQSQLDRAASNLQKKVLEAAVRERAAADAATGAGGDRSVTRAVRVRQDSAA